MMSSFLIGPQGGRYFNHVSKLSCFVLFQDIQPLAKYIAALDPRYNSLFMDNVWKEAFEHSDTAVGM